VIAVAAFLLRVNWTLHFFYDPIPALAAKQLWPSLSKTDLSALRLVNVLSMALVVATLMPRTAKFLSGRAAWPLVVCGKHSLHIFCLGILLAVTGHLILSEYGTGAFIQGLVAVGGTAVMIAVAAMMDWFPGGKIARRAKTRAAASGHGGERQ
jgi:hypothetical protein